MYIEHGEYLEKGGAIETSATFVKYEKMAEKEIDYRTFNRIDKNNIPEEVKDLMVILIDKLQANEKGDISSFSNDGVSIAYNNEKTQKESNSELIDTYLANVTVNGKRLTYRGVYADEHI